MKKIFNDVIFRFVVDREDSSEDDIFDDSDLDSFSIGNLQLYFVM